MICNQTCPVRISVVNSVSIIVALPSTNRITELPEGISSHAVRGEGCGLPGSLNATVIGSISIYTKADLVSQVSLNRLKKPVMAGKLNILTLFEKAWLSSCCTESSMALNPTIAPVSSCSPYSGTFG